MSKTPDETWTQNLAWASAAPTVSVLIPFLRDDPALLLAALASQATALDGQVEIICLDDGSADASLAARVGQAIQAMASPAGFLCSHVNLGRAKGRNRLAKAARGRWLLFLDADMLPDGPGFLGDYLALIADAAPAVVFGGFSLAQAPPRPQHALHRKMAAASDCASAEVRRLAPEKHVFTSNLLVRGDVFEAFAFDEAFAGWGWEDVEWAMRVAAHHPILHIDNTATHLGLDPAAVIAAKYEQSASNFARVVEAHRAIVERYPSYKAAQMLKRVPARTAWRPALKALALAEGAPLAARALAMRLYRAALYAEAV
jgi:glycosyltransferase involved in cell wall biosynthesis